MGQARPKRPARGTPAETRARLLAAAAEELNRVGYHGTDSNRLARAAGYAPGTFYKHFADKKEVLLAAYEGWVTTEWAAIEDALAAGGAPAALAAQIVDGVLELHRRWRGLRASLRALVATDADARAVYRAQRVRQLDTLARLRVALGTPPRAREDDAMLLFALERVADGLADGEARALGLGADALRARLCAQVAAHLAPAARGRARRR